MILIGFLIYKDAPEERSVWRLGFCTGVALILAAFGTRADAQWRGAVVTGAGALVMFWSLTQFGGYKPAPKTARVIFYTKYPRFVELVGLESAGTPLPGAWVIVGKNYFFRVLESDFEEDNCLSFVVSADFNDNGKIDDNEEYTAELHRRHLQEALTTKKPARFWFDQESRAVFKTKEEFKANKPPIGSGICSEPVVEDSHVQSLGSAFAAVVNADLIATSAFAQSDTTPELLIEDLQATSSSVRRQARNLLAQSGLPAVPLLIDAYKNEPEVYRVKLGVVYVLGQMQKLRSASPAQLSAKIPPQTLRSLVNLIDDPDKTVRQSATSFFVDLGDQTIVPTLLDIIGQPNSTEGRYNAAFVISKLWPSLDQTVKENVKVRLEPVSGQLGEQTLGVLSEIFADQGNLSSDPTGWAYVGLFDGKTWDEHFFKGNAPPSVGETLTATSAVNIRTGPIQFDKKLGWVNKRATGIIKPGQKIDVLEVKNIADGFIWVRFSAAGSVTADTQKQFYVVVGAFSTAGSAVNYALSLRKKGYDPEVHKSTTGFYPVTIGKTGRASAERLREKVLTEGTAPKDTYLHDGSRFTRTIAF